MNEMIEYQASGRPARGYLASPDQAADAPGVLVLHAWWGLTPFFQGLCDRLAGEGFTAFAPDLYGGQTADTVAEAQQLMEALDFQETRERVTAALTVLKSYSGTPNRVGELGISLGAAWELYISSLQLDDLQAVVIFYGSEILDYTGAECAYLGHFSDADEW